MGCAAPSGGAEWAGGLGGEWPPAGLCGVVYTDGWEAGLGDRVRALAGRAGAGAGTGVALAPSRRAGIVLGLAAVSGSVERGWMGELVGAAAGHGWDDTVWSRQVSA